MKALAKRTKPGVVPVFPLRGSIMLPGCDLPLNIFEPRYMNMVDDALKGDRLIGMVQPAGDRGRLNPIGSLGRIIQFAETADGRYMIVLRGLKRFKIKSLADAKTPYKQADISFKGFEDDINAHEDSSEPEAFSATKSERSALVMAMKSFAKSLGVQVVWEGLKDVPLNRLVDQATMISPFGPEDKQSLLEAESHDARRRLLIGLMHLYSNSAGNDSERPKQ
jgi:Lon protease-like protein